mmetsp:Transcript_22779/g.77027  ORF Transcript_22779/g.77027 Transcript_22779/m.77027 type:complete len:288 (-) Transcript_22779:652-1515(-)
MIEWCTSSFCWPRNSAQTEFKEYELSLWLRHMYGNKSNMTRPSTVVSTFSRLPKAADWNVVSRMRAAAPRMRPSSGTAAMRESARCKTLARFKTYGMSKFCVLYPVMMSGSTALTKEAHFSSMSFSVAEVTTSAPLMGRQPLSVKMASTTLLARPCSCTTHEIWITGSCSASGKWPLRPAHSMSNAKMRIGASLDHAPSGACATTESKTTSTSRWHRDFFSVGLRSEKEPRGSSSQEQPVIPISIIKRSTNGTFDSYVRSCSRPWPGIGTPSPRTFFMGGIMPGSAR